VGLNGNGVVGGLRLSNWRRLIDFELSWRGDARLRETWRSIWENRSIRMREGLLLYDAKDLTTMPCAWA
jgi:hypothetical protein